ncbi:amidase [Geodermatophilus chilensis]|uniref:amidase n=1 Tax=Geodermatophilus chilensis TaxID=2035835 RepID=UPI001E548DB6|nr:amidase [Geodermatophilus chilensis]
MTPDPAAVALRATLTACGLDLADAELAALAAEDVSAATAMRLRHLPLRDVEPARPVLHPSASGPAEQRAPAGTPAASPRRGTGGPDDPAGLGLQDAAALVAAGELSPTELTRAVLDRIDRLDPALESYVEVYAEEALTAAKEAEEELRLGRSRGPLHGLPVALKDLYDVTGRPTLAGSEVRAGHVADEDSEITRRLREAGAVLLGKTVTHEFAFGVVSAPTHNPWDLGTVPGGSSGGSGAAVAADLCLMAMGTDTGGSIRIPAGLCGVVGLKPTFGRVSKRGVAPLSWSLDHAGPLAKTVGDAALALQVLAGYDPMDPSSIDVPVDDYLSGLSAGVDGLRVGVPTNFFFDVTDPGVEAAVRAALQVLADAGAALVEVEIPEADLAADVVSVLAGVESSAIHQEEIRRLPDAYTKEVRGKLRAGELVSGTTYVNAQRARALVQRGFAAAFDRVDVVATPTLAIPAPPYGSTTALLRGEERPILFALNCLTAPANAAGLPALSVPCGFTGSGLPVGLQLMGRPFDEATVLRAGAAYEAATTWHLHSPPLPA